MPLGLVLTINTTLSFVKTAWTGFSKHFSYFNCFNVSAPYSVCVGMNRVWATQTFFMTNVAVRKGNKNIVYHPHTLYLELQCYFFSRLKCHSFSKVTGDQVFFVVHCCFFLYNKMTPITLQFLLHNLHQLPTVQNHPFEMNHILQMEKVTLPSYHRSSSILRKM